MTDQHPQQLSQSARVTARGRSILSLLLFFAAAVCFALPFLTADEFDGVDPSLPSNLIVGDLPEGLAPANEGAFEGGPTGTPEDAAINFLEPEGGGGGINVPTDSPPSPLFGVLPFTQQLHRFEEFGPAPVPDTFVAGDTFPSPINAQNGPSPEQLEAFLAQPVFPEPTRLANCVDSNPWQPEIEAFLGRELETPPAEGRPPGEGWAHQRFDEFPPQVLFQTAQAGARDNLGLRDSLQRHGYAAGEFAPGGLYHNTVGTPGFEGTTAGIDVRFHPGLPKQEPNALWCFDGTFPLKLLNVLTVKLF